MSNSRLLFFFIFCISSSGIFAQSKYGNDSLACLENRALYYQSYQQKDYANALKPWRWAFNNCPLSSENIFRNGPKIIKARMKVDSDNRGLYIDTLMMIFDKRIEYFNQEGYVLGLKGYELVISDKKRSQQALTILSKSIQMEGNKSGPQAVYAYMKAVVNLEKEGVKTESDVLNAYSLVSEIINYNIINETKSTKYFIKFSEKIEKMFANYAKCEDLITLFTEKFEDKIDDINALGRMTELLEEKNCTDSDLFFKASSRLFELEPSASSADKMSKMSISKGKYSDAISFAKQSISMEEDENQKAIYHLGLADAYRNSGSYMSARSEVYKSLEIRKGWGEAYMNLGNIYLAGVKNCDSDFVKSTIYWVAVDAFKRALSDEETYKRASKSINTYSKYFPSKETCFFNGVEPGKSYTVGCWINKATIVRTSD